MTPALKLGPRVTPPHPFFEREHRALDHVLADVEFLADRRSFRTAAKRFGEFRRAVEAHLRDEEDVLLPFFVEHTRDPKGIAPQIRGAHRGVLEALEAVGSALSQEDHNAFCTCLTRLDQTLRAHQSEEERLLYPELEALLPDHAAWEALRARTLGPRPAKS